MLHWKRNVVVLCIAQLLTMVGFSAYLSFVPYYVQELGAETYAEATRWLALFEGGSALAMMVASPIWGGLADRHGRKMMLLRATAAGAITAFLLGVARTPTQLVVIRVVQGALCGTVSAAMTMVATATPEEHLGVALGMMQTVQFVAQAVGPLVGGVAADALGYRAVFPISSALMAGAALLVLFLVKEEFRVPARASRVIGPVSLPKALSSALSRSAVVMLLVLGSMRFALALLSPVVALYIKSLSPGTTRLATLAGAVVSVGGVTSSIAALAIGRLGDRLGQRRILLMCTLGVALVYIPQAFVANAAQLILLRAVEGLFSGGMMPTANALLARSSDSSRRGFVFGVSTSVQAAARAVGPALGAGVANLWGLSSVFLVSAGMFAVIALLVAVVTQTALRVAAEPERASPAGVCGS